MKKYILIACLFIGIYACTKDSKINFPKYPNSGLTPYQFNLPLGLPPIPTNDSLPITNEGVALGKKLFYDPILSGNNKMACGSCHLQTSAFVDTARFSSGITGALGTRNSMPLFNLAYSKHFFWDGGAKSLEDQVIGPIQNPLEMNANLKEVITKLNNNEFYKQQFKLVFGRLPITTAMLMKAIAQFEKTILSGNSKYDLYKSGKVNFTQSELDGLNIYLDENKGDCSHCHTFGSTFTDFDFKDNGLDSLPIDKGRYLITLKNSDIGKFKTPSLRNISLTAPYMHDGRFKTLEECINHYNVGFKNSANLDVNIANKTKGRLSQQDISNLIAFLKTLTDESIKTNNNFSR
jgi:cytochrome c peroxidase